MSILHKIARLSFPARVYAALAVGIVVMLSAQTTVLQPLHGPDAHSVVQHAAPRTVAADTAATFAVEVSQDETWRASTEHPGPPASQVAAPPELPPRSNA